MTSRARANTPRTAAKRWRDTTGSNGDEIQRRATACQSGSGDGQAARNCQWGLEADHAGRLSVGAINHAFLEAGGNGAEYGAAMHRAVAGGWMEAHPSGAYVKLTQKGAEGSGSQCPARGFV